MPTIVRSTFRTDYPSIPTKDETNPYYKCAHCGRTDPQINGRVSGHFEDCVWRRWVEAGEEGDPPTPCSCL